MALKENMPSVGGFLNTAQYAKNFSDMLQQNKINEQNRVNAENTKIFNTRRLDQADAAAESLGIQRGVENEQNALRLKYDQENMLRDDNRAAAMDAWNRGAAARDAARKRQNNLKFYEDLKAAKASSPEAGRIFGRSDLGAINGLGDGQGPLVEGSQGFIDKMNAPGNQINFQNPKKISNDVMEHFLSRGYSIEDAQRASGFALKDYVTNSPESVKAGLESSSARTEALTKAITGGSGSGGRGSNGQGSGTFGDRASSTKYVEDYLKDTTEPGFLDSVFNVINPANDPNMSRSRLIPILASFAAEGIDARSAIMALEARGNVRGGEFEGTKPSELLDPENSGEMQELYAIGKAVQSNSGGMTMEQRLSGINAAYDDKLVRDSSIVASGSPSALNNQQLSKTFQTYLSQNAIDVSGDSDSVIETGDSNNASITEASSGAPVPKPFSSLNQYIKDNSIATKEAAYNANLDAVVDNRKAELKPQQLKRFQAQRARDNEAANNALERLGPKNIISRAAPEEQESMIAEAEKRMAEIKATRGKTDEEKNTFANLRKLVQDHYEREELEAKLTQPRR